MTSRHYVEDDVSSRYRERPSGRSRDVLPRRGDERYYEEEVEYTRLPPREPPRERETIVREEVRRERSPPAFLRDDYGRTNAGPMVLRAREREQFEFAPRPRRRSLTPSPERKVRSEEIIIRGDDGRRGARSLSRDREEVIIKRSDRDHDRHSRVPSLSRDREEVIIRRDRDDRDLDRRTIAPSRRGDLDREEIVIREDRRPGPRRDEIEREDIIIRDGHRKSSTRVRDDIDREEIIIRDNAARRVPATEIDYERDEVVSRRGGPSRYDPPPPRTYDREEIIIDRDRDTRSRVSDYALTRRPRSLSRSRSHSRERDEVIIRRDERTRRGRGGSREREEIIIRRDRSASSSRSRAATVPEDRNIRAPDIHQNVITHHHHVYHDDMRIARSRPRTPPLPPTPPPAPREEETIEIHRHGERNGRAYDEDIVINRGESPGGALTRRRLPREDYGTPPEAYRPLPYDPPPRRYADPRDERDVREEAEFYNQRALERSYPGEGHRGATRDWAIVDVPPGTRRVRMDGAGGGAQEITWQRYNGVRRSRFMPDGASSDEGYGSEVGRPAMGDGRRYHGVKDPRDGLWTEITKDLVVREAIEEMGYEFEETDDFYYIIAYLRYDDVSRLVGLSEDIRHARRRRIKELSWENRALPPPEERRETLMIEEGPRRDTRPWDREDEVFREREVVIGRRPPH